MWTKKNVSLAPIFLFLKIQIFNDIFWAIFSFRSQLSYGYGIWKFKVSTVFLHLHDLIELSPIGFCIQRSRFPIRTVVRTLLLLILSYRRIGHTSPFTCRTVAQKLEMQNQKEDQISIRTTPDNAESEVFSDSRRFFHDFFFRKSDFVWWGGHQK